MYHYYATTLEKARHFNLERKKHKSRQFISQNIDVI